MSYGADEERGRFLLRLMLWLVFICQVGRRVIYYPALDRQAVLYLIATLLPTAVVCWAVHRGSWPGFIAFFLSAFDAVASLTGALAEASLGGMARAELVLSFLALLLKLTVVFSVWHSGAVGRYLAARRAARTRRDLVLELVLFAFSLALLLAALFRAANGYL